MVFRRSVFIVSLLETVFVKNYQAMGKMKFKLIKQDRDWYWQNASNAENLVFIDLKDFNNLIKAIKKMLYEIAWNDNSQRSLYAEFLSAIAQYHPQVRDALYDVLNDHEELEKLLINLEIYNGGNYNFEEDFSDDSDNELDISSTNFHLNGDILANRNPQIIELRQKFGSALRYILSNNFVA